MAQCTVGYICLFIYLFYYENRTSCTHRGKKKKKKQKTKKKNTNIMYQTNDLCCVPNLEVPKSGPLLSKFIGPCTEIVVSKVSCTELD